MRPLSRFIPIACIAAITLATSSSASAAPSAEAEALRFISAYRADEAPLRMLRTLGQVEVEKGNLAKGAVLACIAKNLPPQSLRAALVPFTRKQLADSDTLNRISAFLESALGQRMLDAIEANFSTIATMVDNKIETKLENALGLSVEDQAALHDFEQTADYEAFNRFVNEISGVFAEPSLRSALEEVKQSCRPK